MQLSITARHLDITDALRDYVTSKITRLERHYDHITNVQVVLDVNKMVQRAEAIVHAGHHHMTHISRPVEEDGRIPGIHLEMAVRVHPFRHGARVAMARRSQLARPWRKQAVT